MHTQTVSRTEWLKARLALLDAEKELTRRSDRLAAERQAMPRVRIDKDYSFDTEAGKATLKDLFGGRSQLMIYHFMFGPDYKAGCPSCSSIADGYNGIFVHLQNHDIAFWTISRAPLEKLLSYRERMGWTFPWASAFATDFNVDFNVYFTEEQQRDGGIEYNYRREPAMDLPKRGEPLVGETMRQWTKGGEEGPVAQTAATVGTDVATFTRERPGVSAFVLENGVVYHTYSGFARGLDGLWGMYQWLDRAPKGRNEDGFWWRRHDEYGK
jgi:predicted dithiol-disulfide oxidoreductase (DUF899 family)